MVWEARVIQIRPHNASKKMKLGYQVESPQNHTCTTVLQPQARDHRPAPNLEVDKNQLKAPFIRSAVLPDDVRKRDPAAVGKVIFELEAVGVSGVVDITGTLVGGAL